MSFQFAPPDWLVCDGSEHKVSDCEQLAKVIGESLKSGLGVIHNAHSIDKLLTVLYCSSFGTAFVFCFISRCM